MDLRFLGPCRMLVFDWDGTAVASRTEPVHELLAKTEVLLARGIFLVIVTGTHFGNIQRQFGNSLSPTLRKGLIVCCNRGSEVYGYDEKGKALELFRREATRKEDALLDRVAEEVGEELKKKYGLKTSLVSDRLNRRKLDLIPLPEWQDPPKECIDELLDMVLKRLKAGGLEDGIAEIIRMMESKSHAHGLAARVTTDVKHVEIGLTDKSDSMEYILKNLAPKKGIAPSQILIVGDEFGPICGFEGSDFKMVIPLASGSTYISVGKEPNGVPPEVVHIGGGIPAFLAILDAQIALARRRAHRERTSTVQGEF